MPLDSSITGRIATLAGDDGFGWVEAIGIRDGRVAFAGSAVDLETRADPFTERIELEPDEVAIPGLTDAHLHLAAGRRSPRGQVDLTDAATLDDGLAAVARRPRAPWPTRRLARGPRLGRRPLGPLADRRRPRGGRARAGASRCGPTTTTRCWASRAALAAAGDRRATRRTRRRDHPPRRATASPRASSTSRRPGS